MRKADIYHDADILVGGGWQNTTKKQKKKGKERNLLVLEVLGRARNRVWGETKRRER